MDLDGGFEEMGQFWPASVSEPEHPWPGKITVDSDGSATVEIFSAFTDEGESFLAPLGGTPHPGRILGVTETNKAVTLDRVASTPRGGLTIGKVSGVRQHFFWSDRVLFGHHYDEDQEIRFDRVALSVEHAYEWFGLSGLRADGDILETPAKMTLSYEQPAPILFQLPHGIAGRVRFGFTGFTYPVPWDPKFGLEQTCSISLDAYHDYWSLDDVKELAGVFQSLVAVVTASPARLTAMSASRRDGPRRGGRTDLANVVVTHRPYSPGTADSRTLHPNDMLFTYGDVQEVFSETMSNWLGYWQSAEYAIRAVMQSRFGQLTLDDHLRTLTQAVDVALGKDRGENVEFKKLVRYLAETCWAEWETDLDVNAFAEAVRKYRNWFVHFDGRRARVKVDYGEVAAICHNLGAMLDIYMVSKCVPDSIQWRDLVTENGDLKWLLKKRLYLHPKHRRQTRRDDSSPNEARGAD